jgi:hypothetical protein
MEDRQAELHCNNMTRLKTTRHRGSMWRDIAPRLQIYLESGCNINLAICHALIECDSGVTPGDDQQKLKTLGARLSNNEAGTKLLARMP